MNADSDPIPLFLIGCAAASLHLGVETRYIPTVLKINATLVDPLVDEENDEDLTVVVDKSGQIVYFCG